MKKLTSQELHTLAQQKCATLKLHGSAYHAWVNIQSACYMVPISGTQKSAEEIQSILQEYASSPRIPTSRKAIYNRCIQYVQTK